MYLNYLIYTEQIYIYIYIWSDSARGVIASVCSLHTYIYLSPICPDSRMGFVHQWKGRQRQTPARAVAGTALRATGACEKMADQDRPSTFASPKQGD